MDPGMHRADCKLFHQHESKIWTTEKPDPDTEALSKGTTMYEWQPGSDASGLGPEALSPHVCPSLKLQKEDA